MSSSPGKGGTCNSETKQVENVEKTTAVYIKEEITGI
jgi:hypothetical protein